MQEVDWDISARAVVVYFVGRRKSTREACLFPQSGTQFAYGVHFRRADTGLHFHDIRLLLKAFDRLIAMHHTVVVVEHNMDVIKCADHIIDMGPEGGNEGGCIVAAGTPEEIVACPQSVTGRFLKEKLP